MNTDAMKASACFTATFMKYRDPVKSTEYRTYSADLDFARSQVSYETSPSKHKRLLLFARLAADGTK